MQKDKTIELLEKHKFQVTGSIFKEAYNQAIDDAIDVVTQNATIKSDNTQTLVNALEDIKLLREGLLLVNKESTNFRLKAPHYMVDRIDYILEQTAKYEKA